jgi:hypothetical protein
MTDESGQTVYSHDARGAAKPTGPEKVLLGSEQTVNAFEFINSKTISRRQSQKRKFIHALKGVWS